MPEKDLTIRLKVNDDGSIVLDKFSNKLAQIPQHIDTMNTSLNLIKWDSLVNLGEKAIQVSQQFMEFVEIGAKVKAIQDSFSIMSMSVGINANTLITKLKEVTDATIDDSDLMKKANRMMMENFSAEQIVQVGEAARVAARVMGTDVSSAYESITDSVVNLRERGLKTAGFVIDFTEAYKKHADQLGVTVEELSNYGKQVAVVNALEEKRIEMLGKLGPLQETEYEHIQKNKAAWQELKETVGGMALKAWQNITEEAGKMFFIIRSGVELVKGIPGVMSKTVEGPEAAVELANRAAAVAASVKGPSEVVTRNKLEQDLKVYREVNTQLLKDEENTLKRITELQTRLNTASNEAVSISERLGVGTKAALTQWIEQDVVGEYEKLLGSKIFSEDEMTQLKAKYTQMLNAAMGPDQWGDLYNKRTGAYDELENAIRRINDMKVGDTQLAKASDELQNLQNYMKYLDTFVLTMKIDSEQLLSAKTQVDELRVKLQDIVRQNWAINIAITGTGSSQAPISDKIAEIYGGFENMSGYIANMKANVEMSDINAQIAQYQEKIRAYSAIRPMVGGGENYYRSFIPGFQQTIADLEKQKQMITGAQAAFAAPAAAAPSYEGGDYGGGNLSINIGTIEVNGANAAEVATDLDAQLADLYLRDRSKLKNAIVGKA